MILERRKDGALAKSGTLKVIRPWAMEDGQLDATRHEYHPRCYLPRIPRVSLTLNQSRARLMGTQQLFHEGSTATGEAAAMAGFRFQLSFTRLLLPGVLALQVVSPVQSQEITAEIVSLGSGVVALQITNDVAITAGEVGLAYNPDRFVPIEILPGPDFPGSPDDLFSSLTPPNGCNASGGVTAGLIAGWINSGTGTPLEPGTWRLLQLTFQPADTPEGGRCSPLEFVRCLGATGAPVRNTVSLSDDTSVLLQTTDGAVCGPPTFRRGDANGDGLFDITDAVFILRCLFQGPACTECPDASDSNDDDAVDISDPVYLLRWRFLGESPPPPPNTQCGLDPTEDTLGSCSYPPCCRSGGLCDGAAGHALQFDGTDDFVEVPDNAVFRYPDGFSLAFWISLDEAGSSGRVLTKWRDGDEDLDVQVDNGKLFVRFVGTTLNLLSGDLPAGKWQHVVVTLGSGKGTLYVNGKPFREQDVSGSIAYSPSPIRLGAIVRESTLRPSFRGRLDDVAIFHRALVASEVSGLLLDGLSGTEEGLSAAWLFEEGEGQVAGDSSPNEIKGRLGDTTGPDTTDPQWVERS